MIDLYLKEEFLAQDPSEILSDGIYQYLVYENVIIVVDQHNECYDKILLNHNFYEVLQPSGQVSYLFIVDNRTQRIIKYNPLLRASIIFFQGDLTEQMISLQSISIIFVVTSHLLYTLNCDTGSVLKKEHKMELKDSIETIVYQNGLLIINDDKQYFFDQLLQISEIFPVPLVYLPLIPCKTQYIKQKQNLQIICFQKLINQCKGYFVFIPIVIYYDRANALLCISNFQQLNILKIQLPGQLSQLSICCCKSLVLLGISSKPMQDDETTIQLFLLKSDFSQADILMNFNIFGDVKSLAIVKNNSIVLSVVQGDNTIFIKRVEDGPLSIGTAFNTSLDCTIAFDIGDNQIVVLDECNQTHLIATPQHSIDDFSHLPNPTINVFALIPEVVSCYCTRFNKMLSDNFSIAYPPGVDVELFASQYNVNFLTEEIIKTGSNISVGKHSYYRKNSHSFTIDTVGLTDRMEDLRNIACIIATIQSRSNSMVTITKQTTQTISDPLSQISNLKDTTTYQKLTTKIRQYSIHQNLIQSLYQSIKVSGHGNSELLSYNLLSLMFTKQKLVLDNISLEIFKDLYQKSLPIFVQLSATLNDTLSTRFDEMLVKIFGSFANRVNDNMFALKPSIDYSCYTNSNNFVFSVSVLLCLCVLAGLYNIQQFQISLQDFQLIEEIIDQQLEQKSLYIQILLEFLVLPNQLTMYASIVLIRKFMNHQVSVASFDHDKYLKNLTGLFIENQKSDNQLPYLIIDVESRSQPLYYYIFIQEQTLFSLNNDFLTSSIQSFKNNISQIIAIVFSLVQTKSDLPPQQMNQVGIAFHSLAYNMYFVNKIVNHCQNDEVDIQSQIALLLLKYNYFLNSIEQQVFVFEQLIHYVIEIGVYKFQDIFSDCLKLSNIQQSVVLQSLSEFVAYCRYNYPSILYKLCGQLLNQIFKHLVEVNRLINHDNGQGFKAIMDQLLKMVQNIIQSSQNCQHVISLTLNKVYYQYSNSTLSFINFLNYNIVDLLLPVQAEFDVIKTLNQVLVAYSSLQQYVLINLNICEDEFILIPLQLEQSDQNNCIEVQMVQQFLPKVDNIIVGIDISADYLKIKLTETLNGFVENQYSDLFKVPYFVCETKFKMCGALKNKHDKLIVGGKMHQVKYFISKEEVLILVKLNRK